MPPRHRRRSPWYIAPIALVIAATSSFALATQAERQGRPPQPGTTSSATPPVLSARRVPALVAAPVADDRLYGQLQALVDSSPGPACLEVSAAGRPIYAASANAPMTPASLQKIVTGAAAMAMLGAQSTLTTRVVASVPPANGVVDGDLYLVGGGDPLLMTDRFVAHLKHPPPERSDPGKLADAVVAAGIKVVHGRLLGDESRYDTERYPPSWPSRFATEAESGPLSALTIDRGLDEFPPTPEATTPRAHPTADPPIHAASIFASLLEARGVTIGGGVAAGAAPPGAPEIATLPSAPVQALVAETLRESDNMAAELLNKEMGLAAGGGGTTVAGVAAARATLQALGLPLDGTVQVDGSGLSDLDRETCGLVQALLQRDGTAGPLSSGLPVAGLSGTLEKRFVGSAVVGRLRAKTGSLIHVTALAGVLPTARGATLTFSYVLNVGPPGRVTDDDVNIQDGLVEILDSYPQGPDLAALGPLP